MAALLAHPPSSARFEVDSQTSLYRAVSMVRKLPFLQVLPREDQVLLSTVVSELATNILKFAGRGTITIRRAMSDGHDAIVVIAEDEGCGIPDIDRVLEEGYSTTGTLGLGLPAVRRIMSTLKIHSEVGRGTRIVAARWLDDGTAPPPPMARGAAPAAVGSPMALDWAEQVRPKVGESVSGDVTVVRSGENGLLFGVIDVSGHGAQAHDLAAKLHERVMGASSVDLTDLLTLLHETARGTRGAAVGLAFLDRRCHELVFAGIGNVSIRALGIAQRWRGVSRDGILGERSPKAYLQTVDLAPGDIVVMASDGVSDRALSRTVAAGTPLTATEIAEAVMRDAARKTDDASCVVVRCQ